MDYSAANHALWNFIIQLGMIAGAVLFANFLRQRVAFIRKSLMPIAVLAGFLLLALKYTGLISVDEKLFEMLVYHGIALGFIAMSLRVPVKGSGSTGDLTGLKSGLLLPMGYGQGPGQANNVGSSYEALGFAGGRSFGLSIAAAGYLVACVVGVVILNLLARKNKIRNVRQDESAQFPPDYFQSSDEIPISDSIDKLSVQICMVLLVYLATYLTARGLTSGIAALSPGLAGTVNTLIWGFNFIIGSALAILLRVLLESGKNRGRIRRQYQNNYLLNRISGFFFDVMIVAGIASINLEDIRGLWLPFLLLAVCGAIVTWVHLRFVCRKVYPDYYYEGLISMYGMLTGTISSGVLLLREIDPNLETPAANNLVVGSSFGIILGAPVLILVGFAPKSALLCWVTLGLAAAYMGLLVLLIMKLHRKK